MIVINNDKDSLREKALSDHELREKALSDHDNDRIHEALGEVEE